MDNSTAASIIERQMFTTTVDSISTESVYIQDKNHFSAIVLPVIYSLVCIVGLIGNGLVIYIIHLKTRKNITDLYVLNLAIADFIFVAMLPFWTTSIALDRWVFGQILCKLTSGSTYIHLYASVFFLTTMSVDRFLAVVMYQTCRRTKFSATASVVGIWLISTVLGLLPLYFRDVRYVGGVPKCAWSFDEDIDSHSAWFLVYAITRSIIGFAIPFVIIVISYSLIIIFLKTRETKGRLAGKCQTGKKLSDRATTMVLVIIGVFLLCWLPNQVSNSLYVAQSLKIMTTTWPPQHIHYYIHMFSTCLTWMHSCMNPILYALMREDMRLKLTEIVNHNMRRCCRNHKKRRQDQGSKTSFDGKGACSRNSLKSIVRSQSYGQNSITASFRLTTIRNQSFDTEPENRTRVLTDQNFCPSPKCNNSTNEKNHLIDDVGCNLDQAVVEKDLSLCEDNVPHISTAIVDYSAQVESDVCEAML